MSLWRFTRSPHRRGQAALLELIPSGGSQLHTLARKDEVETPVAGKGDVDRFLCGNWYDAQPCICSVTYPR
jgi:hypothetical protein